MANHITQCQYISSYSGRCKKFVVTDSQYCELCVRRPNVIQKSVAANPETPQLKLIHYDQERNLFLELQHNFVITARNMQPLVIGFIDGDNFIRPLTDDLKKIANDLKLSIIN